MLTNILYLFLICNLTISCLATDSISIEKHSNFNIQEQLSLIADKKYKYLDESRFFNHEKRRNIHWLKNNISECFPNTKEFILTTQDKMQVFCLYINRGKKNLIITAPGLGALKERMVVVAEMFEDYDILMFDWRGHGLPDKYDFRPLKRLFHLDFNCKFGISEEQEVVTVVEHMRENYNYSQIFGFAPCYSSLIFTKAQYLTNESLFDKLILDGAWPTPLHILKKWAQDPKLMFDNKRGGWKDNWYTKNDRLVNISQSIAKTLYPELENLDLTLYLSNIYNTPILFIHGTKDLLVDSSDFEKLWKSSNSQFKAKLQLPIEHGTTHLKEKAIFAHICNLFLSSRDSKIFFTKCSET